MAMSPVWLAAAQEYLSSVALLRSSWRWCCQSSRSPSSRISSAGREQLEHQSHDEWAEIVLIVPRGFPPPSSLVTLSSSHCPHLKLNTISAGRLTVARASWLGARVGAWLHTCPAPSRSPL